MHPFSALLGALCTTFSSTHESSPYPSTLYVCIRIYTTGLHTLVTYKRYFNLGFSTKIIINFYFSSCAASCWRFLDHTQWHIVGRTPLDEGSARPRDLYLETHNTDKRLTSMTPAGFVFVFVLHCFVHGFCFCFCFCVFTVLYFVVRLNLQHTTQTFLPPAGFEPAIPVSE